MCPLTFLNDGDNLFMCYGLLHCNAKENNLGQNMTLKVNNLIICVEITCYIV